MITPILATALFLVSAIATRRLIANSHRLSTLDIPNERSSHLTPTPRGGGIAFVATSLVGFLLLLLNNTLDNAEFLALCCAGIIVADVFLPPIDKLPDEGELIKIDEPAHQVGGCASNTAIALSKLGKKAGIVGMVGSDSIGEQLIELLINEKIDTKAVTKTKEASTSQTIIVPVKNQDRRYIHYFGANSKISVSDIDNGLHGYLYPNQMKIFIFGGYFTPKHVKLGDSYTWIVVFKEQYTMSTDRWPKIS